MSTGCSPGTSEFLSITGSRSVLPGYSLPSGFNPKSRSNYWPRAPSPAACPRLSGPPTGVRPEPCRSGATVGIGLDDLRFGLSGAVDEKDRKVESRVQGTAARAKSPHHHTRALPPLFQHGCRVDSYPILSHAKHITIAYDCPRGVCHSAGRLQSRARRFNPNPPKRRVRGCAAGVRKCFRHRG